MRFVTLTPLIHPSDFPGIKPEWVFILPEWTVEVIERVWNFLCNIPSIKKGSGLDYVLSRNVIRHFLDTIFQQMSPALLDLALKHICKRVSSTYYPPAKKYFGQILNAVVFANGPASKELVMLLTSKILHKNSVDLLGTGSETAYWLHLLGHVVARSNENVLQLYTTIGNVLDASLMHEEKSIRKEGQKLLRKLLRTLSTIRPLDFRSLKPSEWRFDKAVDFARYVHPLHSPSDSEITLYYPEEGLILQAQSIVEKYVSKVDSILTDGAALSQVAVRSCMGCIESLVRGGAAMFPEVEADIFDNPVDQWESDVDESEGNVKLLISSRYRKIPSQWGMNMRKVLALLIKRLCQQYATRENPDVVTVKGLIRVLHFFLSENGYKGPDRDQVNYNKAVYRLWNQGINGTFTRNMAVQKVQGLFNRRMACGVWAISDEAKELLESLHSLSMHDYSVVRKKAQKSLPKVLSRYPSFADRILSSALSTFRIEKSSKSAVNGAIYTVNTTEMMKRAGRSWVHTSSLILGLLSSHCFEEIKVQVRLAELWRSFVPYTCRLSFTRAISDRDQLARDTAVERHFTAAEVLSLVNQGTLSLSSLRSKQEEIFGSTLHGIIEKLKLSGKLHWRFALLSMSALALLFREEIPPTPEIVSLFLNGLVSDVLPLRQLCRAALPTLMRCKCKNVSMEVCKDEYNMDIDAITLSFKNFDLPLTESENREQFIDGLWRGWDGSINTSQNSLFFHPNPAFDEVIGGWLQSVENVNRLCDLLAGDHRLSGDERAADSDKSSVAGMPLPSAPLMNLFESTLLWPRTSAASFSTAINKQNILLIETLIVYAGNAGSSALVAPIQTFLGKYTDREAQCLAAELVSGVIRATVSLETGIQEKVVSHLETILQSTLQNITLESCGDWVEALRFGICNRDPKRFQWLSRAVADITPSVEASTSSAIVSLKLKQSLLIEYGWKGYSFALAIVDHLFSSLSGLSKTVREEAARCLVLVALIDASLPSSLSFCRSRLNLSEPASREVLCNRFSGKFQRLLEAYTAQNQVNFFLRLYASTFEIF